MKKRFGFILIALALMILFAMPAMAATAIADFDGLKSAFATGGEYELSGNVNVTETLVTSKEMTLDLKGHTITVSEKIEIFVGTGSAKGSLVLNNTGETVGTIRFMDDDKNGNCLNLFGNTSKATPKDAIASTLTINKGVSIVSTGYYGVFVSGKGAVFNLNGGNVESASTLDSAAITGRGNAEDAGTTINITGGTIKGGNGTDTNKDGSISGGVAIYHPQEGILNISGGTFTGYDGVHFKSGTLNMTGGTITASGAHVAPVAYGNGSVATGTAVAFISNTGYTGDMYVNISGESKLTSVNSNALHIGPVGESSQRVVSVNISGGTIVGNSAKNALNFVNVDGVLMSVTGGTYSSDPKAYLKAGYVAVKSGDMYVVQQEKAKPVDPILPDVPAVVTPVSADKVVVVSVDVNLTGDAKKEAVEQAATDTATKITTGGIASADLTVNETGKVVVKPEVVEKAIKSVELPKNEVLDTANIVPLPVVEATISKDQVAAITFEVTAKELQAKKAGDVKLFKVISSTKGAFFDFVGTPASADDKMFALQASDIASNDFLSADAAIETGKSYRLTMFVKDGGSFDLNNAPGIVVDPAQLVATKTQTPSSGGSSSGCNAGFAALALLALVPVIYRRKK